MIVEETEYKGRPTLTIRTDENDRFPFSFGLAKAKKIIAVYDDITAFVKKHENDPKPVKNEKDEVKNPPA